MHQRNLPARGPPLRDPEHLGEIRTGGSDVRFIAQDEERDLPVRFIQQAMKHDNVVFEGRYTKQYPPMASESNISYLFYHDKDTRWEWYERQPSPLHETLALVLSCKTAFLSAPLALGRSSGGPAESITKMTA